ncbi:hypothetical protein NBRC116583_29550 [Arenicella sp. 4NH20-0111]|uniref:hypothetical protein n=1 Tax=Arenicella sp. 4NH20-0111 TaxID=3127648 RepID=UPI003109DF94
MEYLLLEIWIFLALAFFLGMFVQWFFCCRRKESETPKYEENSSIDVTGKAEDLTALALTESAEANETVESAISISNDWRPMGFSSAPESVDDIKRIKGIGAVIEKTLNELGIYQFSQIAEWTEDNISWVENSLAFPGRIARENWIEQARTLADGGTTDFAKRVDKGDVEY